ncbi:hypothetical protein [Thermococcus waiotapuensis]|uniref:Uncharacterized protein n=1 Tax=Thermococcus waiotapuensis TaxID=90909 RepID=A0AAE4T1I5_9EURY|nr:hypothetical protein [Thermococcus waiotapuensis]MDV3104255.1 hypothetical protein [Thermococcus waiotapuensis]
MPFLRGKLLDNGPSDRARQELQWLLNKLEAYYNYVASKSSVEEKHLQAMKSFYREILMVLSLGRA